MSGFRRTWQNWVSNSDSLQSARFFFGDYGFLKKMHVSSSCDVTVRRHRHIPLSVASLVLSCDKTQMSAVFCSLYFLVVGSLNLNSPKNHIIDCMTAKFSSKDGLLSSYQQFPLDVKFTSSIIKVTRILANDASRWLKWSCHSSRLICSLTFFTMLISCNRLYAFDFLRVSTFSEEANFSMSMHRCLCDSSCSQRRTMKVHLSSLQADWVTAKSHDRMTRI